MSVSKSFSALDQFEMCERQFYYRRILGLPEEPSHYLAIGNLYHDCIAAALIGITFSVKSILGVHKDKKGWSCPTPDDKLVDEIEANLERLRAQVFPLLEVRRLPNDTLAIEIWSKRKYTCKIDLISETIPVVRKPDQGLERVPCVIDWKTKFSAKRRQQEDTDRSKQLALYCVETGLTAAAFVEVPRDVDTPLNVVVARFSPEELARWERWFDTQFAAMASRGPAEAAYKLAPVGHPLCKDRFCSFFKRCPGGAGVK